MKLKDIYTPLLRINTSVRETVAQICSTARWFRTTAHVGFAQLCISILARFLSVYHNFAHMSTACASGKEGPINASLSFLTIYSNTGSDSHYTSRQLILFQGEYLL